MSERKQNRIILSSFACVFLLVLAIVLTSSFSIKADSNVANEKQGNVSFVEMSAAGADFLDRWVTGVAESRYNVDISSKRNAYPRNVETAGGLMGYPSNESSIAGKGDAWAGLFSIDANGNGCYTYESIKNVEANGSGFNKDIFLAYAYLGKMTYDLGIDQTEINAFGNGWFRPLIGSIITALYFLSNFVAEFWYFVLSLLEFVNPFVLFGGADSNTDAMLNDLSNMVANGQSLNTNFVSFKSSFWGEALSGLKGLVGSVYSVLTDFSRELILPIIIVVAVFSWLVMKHKSGGSVLRDILIRFIFVAVGIPLMLCCYTTAVSLVKDMTVETSTVGEDIIFSNFVDFENIVYRQFTPVGGSGISADTGLGEYVDLSTGEIKDGVNDKLHAICGKLNGYRDHGEKDNYKFEYLAEDVSNADGGYSYNKEVIDSLFAEECIKDFSTRSGRQAAAFDLLLRYRNGDKIAAADIASEFVSQVGSQLGLYDETEVMAAYLVSKRWEYFLPDVAKQILPTDLVTTSPQEAAAIYHVMAANRFLQISESASAFRTYGTHRVNGSLITHLWGYMRDFYSVMSVYNYLSSNFDDSQITVYSSIDTVNEGDKGLHYSVNIIGPTLLRVIFGFNMIVLFAAMSFVGYAYCISMIVANVKAMIKFVPSVIIGSMGFIRGIASSLVILAAVIIEILATCTIYNVGVQLIASIFDLINGPICEIFKSLGNTKFGLSSTVAGVISIAIIAFIIKMAVDYRYSICHALSDMTTDVINKLLGTNVQNPNLSMDTSKAVASAAGAMVATTAAAYKSGIFDDGELRASIGERMGTSGNDGKLTASDLNAKFKNAIFGTDKEASNYIASNGAYLDKPDEGYEWVEHTHKDKDENGKEIDVHDYWELRKTEEQQKKDSEEKIVPVNGMGDEYEREEDADYKYELVADYAKDKDGNYIYLKNADGSYMTDKDGNKIRAYDYLKDKDGNYVLDENGNKQIRGHYEQIPKEKDSDDASASVGDAVSGDNNSNTVVADGDGDTVVPVDDATSADGNGATPSVDGNGSAMPSDNNAARGKMVVDDSGDVTVISDDGDVPAVVKGEDGYEYRIVKAVEHNGKIEYQPYTEADKNAGVPYSFLEVNSGEPYVDNNGQLYDNMPAESLSVGATNAGGQTNAGGETNVGSENASASGGFVDSGNSGSVKPEGTVVATTTTDFDANGELTTEVVSDDIEPVENGDEISVISGTTIKPRTTSSTTTSKSGVAPTTIPKTATAPAATTETRVTATAPVVSAEMTTATAPAATTETRVTATAPVASAEMRATAVPAAPTETRITATPSFMDNGVDMVIPFSTTAGNNVNTVVGGDTTTTSGGATGSGDGSVMRRSSGTTIVKNGGSGVRSGGEIIIEDSGPTTISGGGMMSGSYGPIDAGAMPQGSTTIKSGGGFSPTGGNTDFVVSDAGHMPDGSGDVQVPFGDEQGDLYVTESMGADYSAQQSAPTAFSSTDTSEYSYNESFDEADPSMGNVGDQSAYYGEFDEEQDEYVGENYDGGVSVAPISDSYTDIYADDENNGRDFGGDVSYETPTYDDNDDSGDLFDNDSNDESVAETENRGEE